MNTAVESYPPRASEEAVGAAEDAGTLNPLRMLGSAARLFGHLPTVTRTGTKLAGELARVVIGRSGIEAERRDWRFQDPTWTGNPGYHRLMQGYLATSGALGALVTAGSNAWRSESDCENHWNRPCWDRGARSGRGHRVMNIRTIWPVP